MNQCNIRNLCNNRTITKKHFNNTTTPCTLSHSSGMAVMTGYPTPIQYFPYQEPINVSENTNLRQLYKRSYWNYSPNANIPNKTTGEINDATSRLHRIKSKNLGKTVYKVGLPQDALISTKSYDPSLVKTTIQRVRNSI
jgi:hypothetical protein